MYNTRAIQVSTTGLQLVPGIKKAESEGMPSFLSGLLMGNDINGHRYLELLGRSLGQLS